MTAKPSGWYDDPDDPTKLRYWDGILWSERTMPKLAPGLDHVGEARPESMREHSQPAGQGERAREYPAHWGPESFDHSQDPHRQRHDYNAPFLPGHTPNEHGQWSTVGQYASLPRRIAASILDWMLVGFATSILVSPFMGEAQAKFQNFNNQQIDALRNGTQPPQLPADIMQLVFIVMAVMTAALVLYDAVLTSTSGRTVGRMAFGMRVESAQGEKVSFGKALVRSLIKWLPAITGIVGLPLAAVVLLVGAGNKQRQGIHDKVGKTTVKRLR